MAKSIDNILMVVSDKGSAQAIDYIIKNLDLNKSAALVMTTENKKLISNISEDDTSFLENLSVIDRALYETAIMSAPDYENQDKIICSNPKVVLTDENTVFEPGVFYLFQDPKESIQTDFTLDDIRIRKHSNIFSLQYSAPLPGKNPLRIVDMVKKKLGKQIKYGDCKDVQNLNFLYDEVIMKLSKIYQDKTNILLLSGRYDQGVTGSIVSEQWGAKTFVQIEKPEEIMTGFKYKGSFDNFVRSLHSESQHEDLRARFNISVDTRYDENKAMYYTGLPLTYMAYGNPVFSSNLKKLLPVIQNHLKQ